MDGNFFLGLERYFGWENCHFWDYGPDFIFIFDFSIFAFLMLQFFHIFLFLFLASSAGLHFEFVILWLTRFLYYGFSCDTIDTCCCSAFITLDFKFILLLCKENLQFILETRWLNYGKNVDSYIESSINESPSVQFLPLALPFLIFLELYVPFSISFPDSWVIIVSSQFIAPPPKNISNETSSNFL